MEYVNEIRKLFLTPDFLSFYKSNKDYKKQIVIAENILKGIDNEKD